MVSDNKHIYPLFVKFIPGIKPARAALYHQYTNSNTQINTHTPMTMRSWACILPRTLCIAVRRIGGKSPRFNPRDELDKAWIDLFLYNDSNINPIVDIMK